MVDPLPLDIKEQVRQAIDIVDLVGSYLPLRRQGSRYVTNCPWHDDTRPSLQVNPDRQSFKCWVCDIGGDIFSFVMRMDNLEFREALEMLAERAGISSPPRRGTTGVAQASDKQALFKAVAWAESLFHRALLEDRQASVAREYLAARGISAQSIERFRLGFAPPSWDWLLHQARESEWTIPVLERVGLVRRHEARQSHYDWFRGRLMFPIRDQRERPIGFGGRVLPQLAEPQAAKYINSPETPLFSKSSQLYALDRAKRAVGQQQMIVVVEGYTDCIMAHQHGIENVVAVLGTALGERHLPVLRRYADAITLVLDGDDAGQRRAAEILELFVAHQIDLRILTLPEKLDPCEFIQLHGGDAFRRRISEAVDALQHKIDIETKGLVLTRDTHRSAEAVERILGSLAKSRPASGTVGSTLLIREQQVLTRVAREFRFPEERLRQRLAELRRGRAFASSRAAERPSAESVSAVSQLPAWDREMLELVLHEPGQLADASTAGAAEFFQSTECRAIFDTCCRLLAAGERPNFDRLLLETEDAERKALLVQLEESNHQKQPRDAAAQLAALLAHAQQQREDDFHREQIQSLEQGAFDEQGEKEVLGQLFQDLRNRQVRNDPTDG